MNWWMVFVPLVTMIASGAAAYGGAWGAVRVELRWIRQELARHDSELRTLRRVLDRRKLSS